jgi:bifunctional enzyme CysN/CysC
MELLRLATAGSVDDGKSTLIGRLLYDSKAIMADQLEAVERTSAARGDDYTDLALLTDGLRAEREQGITIDVAYRYFTTPRRRFIMADTPGHVQYTRNMVTGASTADLALVLVDARNGMVEQSRRHVFLASLLQIPHVVVAVNKMDLAGWERSAFDAVRDDFRRWAGRLDVHDVTFVPISALHGDNVVHRSANTPWYEGPTLLGHLEDVFIASDRNLIDPRFPVQYVLRPRGGSDYRGYAGTVAGGVFAPGDEVMVLPSGFTTTVASIDTADGPVHEAFAPMSVAMTFTDDLDISRGDMVCRPGNQPHRSADVDAMVCWFDESVSLTERSMWAIKHTTRSARVQVRDLRYRLDVNTLHRDESVSSLGMNDIGRVSLRCTVPLMFDEYRRNRATGSFIIIDEHTNATVGAGMVIGETTGP